MKPHLPPVGPIPCNGTLIIGRVILPLLALFGIHSIDSVNAPKLCITKSLHAIII